MVFFSFLITFKYTLYRLEYGSPYIGISELNNVNNQYENMPLQSNAKKPDTFCSREVAWEWTGFLVLGCIGDSVTMISLKFLCEEMHQTVSDVSRIKNIM